MQKMENSIKKELIYLLVNTLFLSVIMQVVFICLGSWTWQVLLGNLFGDTVIMLYYFLLAVTVQKAIEKEEKDAKAFIRTSKSLRTLMLFALSGGGVLVPWFSGIAVVIPLIFPRISLLYRPLFIKNDKSEE